MAWSRLGTAFVGPSGKPWKTSGSDCRPMRAWSHSSDYLFASLCLGVCWPFTNVSICRSIHLPCGSCTVHGFNSIFYRHLTIGPDPKLVWPEHIGVKHGPQDVGNCPSCSLRNVKWWLSNDSPIDSVDSIWALVHTKLFLLIHLGWFHQQPIWWLLLVNLLILWSHAI